MTTGKNNLFTNLKANRLINSRHSGHGICFNQLSNKNTMQNSTIYGTDIHFDGATESHANNITLTGDDSYGLFKGGAIIMMDGAENNSLENITSSKGAIGIGFSDSGKNPYPEHAGQNNSFKNVSISDKSHAAISLGWWNEIEDLSSNNVFEDCSFTNAPSLFVISRSNSNFSFINSSFTNIPAIANTTYRNSKDYSLNNNTSFTNCSFVNGEEPNPNDYKVQGD